MLSDKSLKFLPLIFLAAASLVHGFILTRIIFFPYPENFVYPYLTNQGLVPYKQIFDQHFPGLMFLPINFDNLGMNNEIIARWWLIGITLIVQLLLFAVGRKVFGDYKTTLLANVLFLLWQPFLEGWVLWMENILPIFYLPAFYLTYKFIDGGDGSKRYWQVGLAGLFLGMAVLFKQTAIPLAGLVFLMVLFFKRTAKTVACFLSGFLPIPLLMCVYFWSLGVFKEFWFWTVTFNMTTFAAYARKWPTITGAVRVAGIYSPVLLLPFVKNRKLAVTLAVFTLGSLASAYARFDFVHFQPSLPFVALATSAVLRKLWQTGKLKLLTVVYLLMAAVWLAVFYQGHWTDKVFFFDATTKQVGQKISQYAQPSEEIFLFGPVLHLYQMSQTIPAGRIFVFQFPWFMMETEDRFLTALQTSKPNLVVRDRTVVIEEVPITRFASRLDQYIEENYQVVDKIGVTEFMLRKDQLLAR